MNVLFFLVSLVDKVTRDCPAILFEIVQLDKRLGVGL
jgi:hypothetical protein